MLWGHKRADIIQSIYLTRTSLMIGVKTSPSRSCIGNVSNRYRKIEYRSRHIPPLDNQPLIIGACWVRQLRPYSHYRTLVQMAGSVTKLERMRDIGNTFFRWSSTGRFKSLPIWCRQTIWGGSHAPKPIVLVVLKTLRNIGRVCIMLRLIFPQVCLLELRDLILCMISIPRSGPIEIDHHPGSYLIVRFLPDHSTIRTTRPKRNRPGLPLIFQGVWSRHWTGYPWTLPRIGIYQ